MRRDRFFWLGLWGVAALLGAPGCTKPRSVLSLHVSTDERWGDGATLQSLVVSVHSGGMDGPLRCTEGDAFGCPVVLRLGTGVGQQRLPLTFQLTPTEASDETGVWVEVLGCGAATGCAPGEAVASWSRALAYTNERTETVEVFLTRGRDAGTGRDADASEVVDGDVPGDAADVLDARDVEDASEVVDAPDAVDVLLDVSCSSPRMECGGRCVDTSTDATNCGGCGRACRSDEACAGGACGCAAGRTRCGSECVDLMSDARHCAMCNNACASGRCTSGVCDCPSGQTRCGTDASSVCVDVQTSRANCGMCGRWCDVNSACVRGACVAVQRSCRADVDGGVPAGCGLVRVERGTFMMGAATDCSTPDAGVATCAHGATPPQSNVMVDAFALDAHEVTVGRFRVFWRARMADGGAPLRAQPIRYPNFNGTTRQEIAWGVDAGQEPSPQSTICNWSLSPSSRDAHPINCVDWWTAQEFCVWDRGPDTYGTLQNGRLPTEAEWEYAASGRAVPGEGLVAGRTYPWGEGDPQGGSEVACNRAHWNYCAGEDGGRTRRVGRFAATGSFFDLAGNVWEWTADNYSSYTASCVVRIGSQNPMCSDSANHNRVIRGGASYNFDVADLRSASRYSNPPVSRNNGLGFRCAGTPTE